MATETQLAIDFVAPESEPAKGARQSWGQVVYYLDGVCFGVAPDGRTVCLGNESEVRQMLAGPAKRSVNPLINQIIDLERELSQKEELENARTGDVQVESSRGKRAIRTGRVRVRPTSHIEYKPVNTRHIKTRQRISGGKA